MRDLKNANPNAALTDLPAGDYAYLKSRGLDQHATAILDGHPATDDPGLFNQLHRQSVEDPVAFGKLNLATVSGQMNKAHFDTLSNAQNAINRQTPQDIEATRLILQRALHQLLRLCCHPLWYIDANVAPDSSGHKGKCGAYVFDAIEAGLPEGKKNLFKRTDYAKKAGESLKAIGFEPLLTSSDQLAGFKPQKGDIVVLQDYPGQGYYDDKKNKKGWHDLPAGHIAMFDGKYWVSDAVQNGAAGIWAGKGFQTAKVGMVIYRRKG